MKTIITKTMVLLLILSCMGLHAEETVLDSVYNYEWDADNSSWSLENAEYYTYTDTALSLLVVVEDDEKVSQMLDINGNVLEEITQELNADMVWVNTDKTIKTYDANNLTTSWYDMVWVDSTSQWVIEEGETKTVQEFDANAQLIGQNQTTYTDGAWVSTKEYTYTLNADGLVTEIVAKELKDGVWVNSSTNALYEYDANGNMVVEAWNKPESDAALGVYDVKYKKYILTYNELNQLVAEHQYRNLTTEGEYKTYYRYTYSYDEAGNMTMKIKDKYTSDYTDFKLYRKYIYTYDADGQELTVRISKANATEDGYEDYDLTTYTYDANGEKTSKAVDDFAAGEWSKTKDYTYTIDPVTGFVTEVQATQLEDSVWENTSANALYEYDVNGNIITETWNKCSDVNAIGVYDVLYSKWNRTYDANNLLLSEDKLKVNASDDGYYIYNQYLYTYDADGNVTEKIYNKYNTSKTGVKTYRKYNYEYNAAGQETLYLYTKANSEDSLIYDNYEQVISTYTAEGLLETERTEDWNATDSVWELDEQIKFTYSINSDGYVTSSIESVTEDDVVYVDEEKIESFYTDSLLDSSYVYEWAADAWVVTEKSYFSYEDGVLVSELIDELDERTTYMKDALGNDVLEYVEELNDSVWVKTDMTIRSYDANGNLLSYYDKMWSDVYGWMIADGEKITSIEYNGSNVVVGKEDNVWTLPTTVLDTKYKYEIIESDENSVFVSDYIVSKTKDGVSYTNYSKTSSFYSEPTTSEIADVLAIEGVLYPNPASDYIFLPAGDYNYSIYSISGQMVMSGTRTNTAKITVDGLDNGIYLINYQTEEEQKTERFIIR